MSGIRKMAAIAAITLAAASAAADASTTVAIPVTSIGDGTGIIDNGSMSIGSFNFKPYLTDGSGDTFTISNLSLQINATSPYSASTQVFSHNSPTYETKYKTYKCGPQNSQICISSYQSIKSLNPVYNYYDYTVDSINLMVGGTQSTGQTANQNDEYYGNLSAILNVNDADLAQVNSTGLLDFSINASTNSVISLQGGSVTFDLLAVPAAAVPEATTWAMMILGIGMVGASLRRRQKVTTRVPYAG